MVKYILLITFSHFLFVKAGCCQNNRIDQLKDLYNSDAIHIYVDPLDKTSLFDGYCDANYIRVNSDIKASIRNNQMIKAILQQIKMLGVKKENSFPRDSIKNYRIIIDIIEKQNVVFTVGILNKTEYTFDDGYSPDITIYRQANDNFLCFLNSVISIFSAPAYNDLNCK